MRTNRSKSQFPVTRKTLLVLRFLYVRPGASATEIGELLDLYPRQAAAYMRRRLLKLKLITLHYRMLSRRQIRSAYFLSEIGFDALAANTHL